MALELWQVSGAIRSLPGSSPKEHALMTQQAICTAAILDLLGGGGEGLLMAGNRAHRHSCFRGELAIHTHGNQVRWSSHQQHECQSPSCPPQHSS